jgi:hypothetical protein
MNVPTARFTRRNILQLLPPALVAPALPAMTQNGASHGMHLLDSPFFGWRQFLLLLVIDGLLPAFSILDPFPDLNHCLIQWESAQTRLSVFHPYREFADLKFASRHRNLSYQ